jgi:hypothetical protein
MSGAPERFGTRDFRSRDRAVAKVWNRANS